MRKTTILTLISLFMLGKAYSREKIVRPDDPHISYEGHIDFSNSKIPCFMYSGVTIKVDFKGTTIGLLMKNDSAENYFNIIIDGYVRVLKVTNKDSLYRLASGLKNKLHHVVIFRRTEWHGGNSYFYGLVLENHAVLFSPKPKSKQIEFIGNSITCAYGNEGTSNKEHFSYRTENNYLSYAAITARELNAGYTAVCRSGIGLYNGRGDTTFAMNKLFRQVKNGSTAMWQPGIQQPGMVVIELGNNDFATDVDSARFVQTYLGFLKELKSIYPQTKVICLAGPYNGGPGKKWNAFQSYVKSAVAMANASDKKVYYFSLGTLYPNGSDWHPSVAQHRQLATQLVSFIKKISGW